MHIIDMPQLIWTRISPKKEDAIRHFKYFEKQIKITGQGYWDGDKYEKTNVGDSFAFILGPTDYANLRIYKVVRIGESNERLEHWSKEPHLINRKVIILKPVTCGSTKTYDFEKFVSAVYPDKNINKQFPKQTQRVNEPLPKDFIF